MFNGFTSDELAPPKLAASKEDSNLLARLRGAEPDLRARLPFPQPLVPGISDATLAASSFGYMTFLPSLKSDTYDVE